MTKQEIKEKIISNFIEKGADIEHERWAKWQKYMHSKMNKLSFYVSLPYDLFHRWERQINTPYSELSEQEKESDRKEVRSYGPLLSSALDTAFEEGAKQGMLDGYNLGRKQERERVYKRITEIIKRKEVVHGFQPFGYTDEKKEEEIYFIGYKDGRDMMKIDLTGLLLEKENEC